MPTEENIHWLQLCNLVYMGKWYSWKMDAAFHENEVNFHTDHMLLKLAFFLQVLTRKHFLHSIKIVWGGSYIELSKHVFNKSVRMGSEAHHSHIILLSFTCICRIIILQRNQLWQESLTHSLLHKMKAFGLGATGKHISFYVHNLKAYKHNQ